MDRNTSLSYMISLPYISRNEFITLQLKNRWAIPNEGRKRCYNPSSWLKKRQGIVVALLLAITVNRCFCIYYNFEYGFTGLQRISHLRCFLNLFTYTHRKWRYLVYLLLSPSPRRRGWRPSVWNRRFSSTMSISSIEEPHHKQQKLWEETKMRPCLVTIVELVPFFNLQFLF